MRLDYPDDLWNTGRSFTEIQENHDPTVGFTPRSGLRSHNPLANNIHYDSVSGLLGWQPRFRWILTPGNDLYIVYQHNWLDDPLDSLDGFKDWTAI